MQFLQYDAKCVAKNKQQPPKGQKKAVFQAPTECKFTISSL